jgi:hypothetical protein
MNILASQATKVFSFTRNAFNRCSSTAKIAFHYHADKMSKLLNVIEFGALERS